MPLVSAATVAVATPFAGLPRQRQIGRIGVGELTWVEALRMSACVCEHPDSSASVAPEACDLADESGCDLGKGVPIRR